MRRAALALLFLPLAAFVLSHPRPDFPGKRADWPKGGKPQDAPY